MTDTPPPPVRFGAWVTLDSSVAAEQLARIGFDFVVIDAQHGVLGNAEVRDALIGLTAGGCPLPIARVHSHDPGDIGRMLDLGARGVIVPMVNSAEEARALARAGRYAGSGGQRSYSPVRYGAHFGATPGETDAGVMLLAMIETRAGLDNLEEILDVDGIDGVFVGPYDLSLSLGAVVPFEDRIRPELERALARVCAAASTRSKIAGVYAGTGAEAAKRAAQGFTLINTTHDMSLIRDGATAELLAARAYRREAEQIA